MKRKKVIKVILVVILLVIIATVVAYFVNIQDKPVLSLYIACCGVVLVVNLILSIIFVSKNFKE